MPLTQSLFPARFALSSALVLSFTAAQAQQLPAVQPSPAPLLLKSRGSFIVGGDNVAQTPTQLSYFAPSPPPSGTHVTINQMYVDYMVPLVETGLPIVMLEGATLTGKSYDTTPDGRMGWFEYFVRKDHATYLPDQVSRGRSGFDISVYNDVRAGVKPLSALPNFWRFGDELAWTQFRFGPSFGTAFPDEQFPVEAAAAFSAQAVPDLNYVLPTPNPTIAATATLAAQLKGAVLMGHSQAGQMPLDAALADPTGVRAMVLLEPGGCRSATWTDTQITALAKIPMLVEFGDHLDAVTGTMVNWQNQFNDCQAFIARVKAAGGVADMLHPPELGIVGNSHMVMQDKNNLVIADLILAWLNQHARR